jgi:hypothetical protein
MRHLLTSVALVLIATNARAQSVPTDTNAPPGWHEEMRPRVTAIAGGAVMFGAPYLAGVAGALANPNSTLDPAGFYIPILGPFVELGFLQTATGFDAGARAVAEVGLALDGVAQAVGLGLILYGFAAPKHVLVRNVMPVPLVGRVNGIALCATF